MDFYFVNKKKGISISSKEMKNIFKKFQNEAKTKFDKKTIKAEVDKFRKTFKNYFPIQFFTTFFKFL